MNGRTSLRAIMCVALLVSACGGALAPGGSPSLAPTPTHDPSPSASSPTASAEGTWADDLAAIDHLVREKHISPFTTHPESEWTATLATVGAKIAAASENEQIALIASLFGLLDTHSGLVSIPGGWHFYGLLPYRFSDGWFVIRADDEALVGTRLIGIGGVPIDRVVERLTPLIPHDNENGLLEGLAWVLNSVEYLNGAGIVADPAHPAFRLEGTDGTLLTVDPVIIQERDYRLFDPGWLNGDAPEAVARRAELIWTRLDEADRVFLIALNDYGDMTAAGAAMTAALDSGKADRVVFDMRYLQGGSGDISILDTLKGDGRVNRPGGLVALIGRENLSVGTAIVYFLDTETDAVLVGEATPARANNFTCPCEDLTLGHSGFMVSVPKYWDIRVDSRPAIEPDIPMALSSVDFFAGRDPVLEAAMRGLTD